MQAIAIAPGVTWYLREKPKSMAFFQKAEYDPGKPRPSLRSSTKTA